MSSVPGYIKAGSALGGTGVHIFIVCSGFGLYLSYLNSPKKYFDFIKARIKKVYVPYILIILIAFCIPFMYEENDRFIALLSHILGFKMFIPKYEMSFLVPTWFVSTIIQFYLIFVPLCCVKKRIGNHIFVFVSLLISISYWILVFLLGKYGVRTWNSFFLQFFWEFAFGMCIADRLYNKKSISLDIRLLILAAVLGLTLEGLCGIKGDSLKLFNDIPALIGFGSVAVLLYYSKILNRPILKISAFSYEWFLVHWLVFKIIFRLGPVKLAYQIVLAVIAFIISIFTAYIYSKMMKYTLNK